MMMGVYLLIDGCCCCGLGARGTHRDFEHRKFGKAVMASFLKLM